MSQWEGKAKGAVLNLMDAGLPMGHSACCVVQPSSQAHLSHGDAEWNLHQAAWHSKQGVQAAVCHASSAQPLAAPAAKMRLYAACFPQVRSTCSYCSARPSTSCKATAERAPTAGCSLLALAPDALLLVLAALPRMLQGMHPQLGMGRLRPALPHLTTRHHIKHLLRKACH